MVNYKRIVETVLLLTLLGLAAAAPAADCPDRHHYDQRQNGTENYRLNIDGVVIAVAPAESLLAAASEIDFGDLLTDLEDFESPSKPPSDVKPQDQKPEEKPQDGKPDPAKPDLSDVSLPNEIKGQKKDAQTRKQEKAQR